MPARSLAITFLVALAGLLLGYMFLGRGFAHVGLGQIYIGEVVLALGLVAATFVIWQRRRLPERSLTLMLLLAFCLFGAARTLPYLGVYGLDALRDGVLWGYAAFAVIVYVIVDRVVALRAVQVYGWVVPVFALWLPLSFYLFRSFSAGIDPARPGEFVPLVFFKAGDMAVHGVGALAFLIIAATVRWTLWGLTLRTLVLVPLIWTAFVAGTANRGALLTFALGVLVVAVLTRRARQWVPVGVAACIVLVIFVAQSLVPSSGVSQPKAVPTSGTTAIALAPGERPADQLVTLAVSTTERASPAPTPVPSVPPSATSGSVANASFERGTVDGSGIFGWTARSADVHITAGEAYAGRRFAILGNPRDAYNATLRSSRFTVTDGPDMYVSTWVKAVEGRPGVELYVDWVDRSGELLASTFVASLTTEGDPDWQRCAGVVTAPDGAAMARVVFYESRGHATLGLDEVEVRMGDLIPEPPPTPTERRPATIQQMIENILSIFGSSSDSGLEGTKQFRLAWWGKIVDYTVFGDYFWTGKGFGVNLADSDGFQSTADGSLRAPHNSHLTVLARMGVPGFALWVLLQSVFAVGLIQAVARLRRSGDAPLAVVGAIVLAYWFAMMVDTSFDPYLEGPQGGIWFWSVFGLGMVVTRIASGVRQPS